MRQQALESVRYGSGRADDRIKFTDDALKTILNVLSVFLPLMVCGCADWARKNVQMIDAGHMKSINDKRAQEKKR